MANPLLEEMSTIPSIAALSIVQAYPLGKVRVGMPSQEYTVYKNEWNYFNTVWAYNITVSTLNGSGQGKLPPFEFITNDNKVSYVNGQVAHIGFYSNAGAAGVFNDIF